jgi:hypothetical protein
VSQVIYIGSNIEVYFEIGDIQAVSLLPPEFEVEPGNPIKLYAPRDQVMVLPMGGVESLRKIPGHPLYSDAEIDPESIENAA